MPLPSVQNHLEALERRLRRARALDVASDFDGTLSRIVGMPRLASIEPRAHAALVSLARAPGARVAVLSGRRLADLRSLVRVPGARLTGVSGAEPDGPRRGARPRTFAARFPPADRALTAWIARFPRAWIERKGVAVSLHLGALVARDAARCLAGVRRRLEPFGGRIAITRGARGVDLVARGTADKGVALRRWHARGGRRALLVYLGDDTNDLPALAYARASRGVPIAVGHDLAHARFRLEDPRDVAAFLTWLERTWRSVRGRDGPG